MGFFDKLFGRRADGKIRIKFLSEKDNKDEQEQFLITVGNDESVKKPSEKAKTAEKAAQNDVKVKDNGKLSVSIPKTEKAEPKKSEKKATDVPLKKPVNKKKTVPIKEAEAIPDETGSVTVTEGKATRNGKFDIKRAKDGRYFFCLYASNYAVIAYSQIYTSSSAAMNGIKSIITNAGKTPIEDTTLKSPKSHPFPKWEIYIDKAGEYRFRLYAVNGLQICHSAHGYATKSGCKGGIDSITRFASDAAKIDKTYLK